MIIWQPETKTSAVLAFEARKLNLFVEVCTDSNWIQCWMHWRCTKHWLRPNRSCHLKKACHEIFFEWTVPFKTVKIHLHSKPRSLTVPEWILSRLRWAHSQVVRTWTNSPSWLPLVASEFPVFPNEKSRSSGPALIFEPRTERSCQLQRQICELVLEKGENDDLLAWWASSPHRWSL